MRVFCDLLVLGLLQGSLAFCPKSSVDAGDGASCYYGLALTQTYSDAAAFCENYGGYLASISNVFDNTKVLQLARTQFENLGGVDGFWLGGTYDGKAIIWDDGTNATYANLAAGLY